MPNRSEAEYREAEDYQMRADLFRELDEPLCAMVFDRAAKATRAKAEALEGLEVPIKELCTGYLAFLYEYFILNKH